MAMRRFSNTGRLKAIFSFQKLKFMVFFPVFIIMGFFIVSLAMMGELSFYRHLVGLQIEKAFTLENYILIFTEPAYQRVMIVTLRVALLATLIALGLGYPLSFWIVRAKPSKTRSFVIVAVTISFLISFLIRLYSWIVLLGYYGTINNLFSLLGMSRVILLYNEAAVTIALGQWGAVFAVLFLIGPLQNIDPTLEDAAKTLGSDPVRTFIRVTLPLSLPGVIGVFSALFAWNVASFVTPMIVGGGVVTLIANFIYERFMFTLNYPLGAAMAFVLLTYTLAIWYGVNYFTSKKMPARLTVGGR